MRPTFLRGSLPQIRWAAIVAGVAIALAAHVCLGLFGAALGFAAEGGDSAALGVLAGIWAILSAFASACLGAIFATRLIAAADDRSAWVHGVLVWSVAMVAGALFLSGTIAGSAMGTAYIWNGGIVSNDAGRDTGPGAAIDSAARDASAASLLGVLASLAGLAGAIAGARLGRRAMVDAQAVGEAPRVETSARRPESYTPGMMPPPMTGPERRREGSADTIWSDPAFDRRRAPVADRRRH